MNFLESLLYKFAPKTLSMANENNILGLFNEDFLITKKENLVCGIELNGMSYSFATDEIINASFAEKIVAFNSIGDLNLKILIKRRKHFLKNEELENLGFYAKNVVDKWRDNQVYYENRYFLILETISSIKGSLEKKKRILTESTLNNVTYNNKEVELKNAREALMQNLERFHPRALKANEVLSIFAEYINGFAINFPLRAKQSILTDSYIASSVEFNKDYFLQKNHEQEIYKSIIAIKNYDTDVIESLPISNLLHQNLEFDLIYTLKNLNKDKAILKLTNAIKSAPSIARDELSELKGMVSAERVGINYVSFNILPIARSKEALQESTNFIITDLRRFGFVGVKETINLLASYLSFFPENEKFNVRKRIQTGFNSASLFLFEKEFTGFSSNSWGHSPITTFYTQSGQNYFFNFHTKKRDRENNKSLGHTMIIGASGSGKTTLITFLIMNCLKYDIDILSLDRLNGMGIFTNFFDGEYNSPDENNNFSINPFSLPMSEENAQFLESFIQMMCDVEEGIKDDLQVISYINQAVKRAYSIFAKQNIPFSLKEFISVIENDSNSVIKMQLEKYLKNPLFNSKEDTLNFDKKLNAINMDFIINSSKNASLIAYYLFHKMIYRAKESGRGFLMFIDEFKSYTENEIFNDRVMLALTQARKLNGVMVLALQTIDQLLEVKNSKEYMKNIGHLMIYPQNHINFERIEKEYEINFTEIERNFLINTPIHERKILIKNLLDKTSVIVDVNMSRLDKYINIFNSDSDKVRKMNELKNKFGSRWKEGFLNG
ncbi:VirB4 family type IV secretion/conjugal transfer ATPase [Helicobacter anatolicus]|uniref:VirB4 family type IV secretion/conjugal transfer ATPase n=1 Tax=Helicobacter anatolicus TaxID=2905874 RepID=UPI001E309801|nr:hypothetical protein [Helicobacter anatolicus]MCE3037685.1 hypothetical protein [Helicobacter anatolicus]